jgi:threonine dehydratase
MKDHISERGARLRDEILEGIRLSLQVTHNLAEGAGAAALAGALKYQRPAGGKKVAIIMYGGNLDQEQSATGAQSVTPARREAGTSATPAGTRCRSRASLRLDMGESRPR